MSFLTSVLEGVFSRSGSILERFWVGFWRPKRSQEGTQQQTARFIKISISYCFFQYEIDVGLSKSKQKSRKKAIEKRSKNRAGFEDLFFPIFAGFETILGAQMEPQTEKKSIKNEVAKKMRKKYAPRALRRMAWRNVGPGWGGFRRGSRSSQARIKPSCARTDKIGTADLRQED